MEFKGTKGEWKKDIGYDKLDDELVRCILYSEKDLIQISHVFGKNIELCEENSNLIAEAGNIRQKINCSLTELLEQRDELLEALKDVVKIQEDNYGNGSSTHIKLKSLCDRNLKQLINKILK